jgi:hypothetical protein
MVCKRCGDQVDTDLNAERVNTNGICDACEDAEADTIRNSKEFDDWIATQALEKVPNARK